MKRITKIRVKYFLIISCLILILGIVLPTFMRYRVSIIANVIGDAKETRSSTYKVKFHSNGGTGDMQEMTIRYNQPQNLIPNTFTYVDYEFGGWNTQADGSGTNYDDEQEINKTEYFEGNEVNLYAQWVQGVAMIGNTSYPTLQAAVDAVSTDNTETTIRLLKNVSEIVTVNSGKNIVFDFQGHTVSNDGVSAVIINNGTIKITNGTITSSTTQGAINNNSTGKVIMTGGEIIATGTRQAIYNNGGTVEISGTAYLSATSTERAAVHNLGNGKLYITGGTIVSTGFSAIQNAGNVMEIGAKGGEVSITSPVIQGNNYGITSTTNYSFYDGIIKGAGSAATNNESKITDKEPGYIIKHSTEVIDGVTYKTAYLEEAENVTITFDPNGGTVNETSRLVITGKEIGELPTPSRTDYAFAGWYTTAAETGGTEINPDTVVENDATYYARWTLNVVAKVGDVPFGRLQAAINYVEKNNVPTTVVLYRDVSEVLTVAKNQNIIFDFQTYKITGRGDKSVITNNGTLTMTNGTLESNQNHANIDNNPGGKLIITGGNIISTGNRGAIFNKGGTVEISGSAYIEASPSGAPDNFNFDRATINNLDKGVVTITGGTIIAKNQEAITNVANSKLTIGVKDGNINTSSPLIVGKRNGIINLATLNYYDGIIKGGTATVSGTVTDIETNCQRIPGTEVIDGDTYQTEYLSY